MGARRICPDRSSCLSPVSRQDTLECNEEKDAAFIRLMYNALRFCNHGYEECLADLRVAAAEEKSKTKEDSASTMYPDGIA